MELLTVDEAAAVLNVAPVTVRRWIATGRLPALRLGRKLRVRRDALERWGSGAPRSKPRNGPHAKPRIPRGKPTSADDPLWSIIGIACSDGPGDVSQNKLKYLADAYAPKAE